ncbi:hypothetical protein FHR81_003094 [Actinoalloteichus hoggarensis]|uniref:Uncharacterized protein n=1 Tax=Actinoalloteichus hoggarensis TaxID=1470176 RepID=A0A221W702_9PSEU|nr:hypothetical protein [Actinoalloteichus hoggarensis]ASO21453.1 hypothetical protein AHOG_19155 [Actinoalloteichus hoggarensis]MBB5922042.1 hypothetical protein [Actinoalloteichus hoggarensis]
MTLLTWAATAGVLLVASATLSGALPLPPGFGLGLPRGSLTIAQLIVLFAGTAGLATSMRFRSGADALLVGALAVLPAPLVAAPAVDLYSATPAASTVVASVSTAFGACLVFGAALRSTWSPILDRASWPGAILLVVALMAIGFGGASAWLPARTPLVSLTVPVVLLACAAWAWRDTRRSPGADAEPSYEPTGAEPPAEATAGGDTTGAAAPTRETRATPSARAEPDGQPAPTSVRLRGLVARLAVWLPLIALVSVWASTLRFGTPAGWVILLVAATGVGAVVCLLPGFGRRTVLLASALLVLLGSAGLLSAGSPSSATFGGLPGEWPLILLGTVLLAAAALGVARAESRRRNPPGDALPMLCCLGVVGAAIPAYLQTAPHSGTAPRFEETMRGIEMSRAYATPLDAPDAVRLGDLGLPAAPGLPPAVSTGLLLLGCAALIVLAWPRPRSPHDGAGLTGLDPSRAR